MSAPAAFDDTLDQFLEKRPGETDQAYLSAWEERWNKRIDGEVGTLGDGFGKMMDALQHGLTPAGHATETAHLQALLQSSTVLNSATALLALTHQLKLMVLLSDTKTVGANQEREKQELHRQVQELRRGVRDVVDRIAKDEQT